MSNAAAALVSALRIELAKAEDNERRAHDDNLAQHKAEDAARLADRVAIYRNFDFEETVGSNSSYVAIDGDSSGGVELRLMEQAEIQASASFSREEALDIHAALGRVLGV
jgi:hypothetical protein